MKTIMIVAVALVALTANVHAAGVTYANNGVSITNPFTGKLATRR